MSEARLEAWLEETRRFAPSKAFAQQANAQPSIYDETSDSEVCWAKQAEGLSWTRHFTKTLEWDLPFAK